MLSPAGSVKWLLTAPLDWGVVPGRPDALWEQTDHQPGFEMLDAFKKGGDGGRSAKEQAAEL